MLYTKYPKGYKLIEIRPGLWLAEVDPEAGYYDYFEPTDLYKKPKNENDHPCQPAQNQS